MHNLSPVSFKCYTLLLFHNPSSYIITGPKERTAGVNPVPQVQHVVTTDFRHGNGYFLGVRKHLKARPCDDLQCYNAGTFYIHSFKMCVEHRHSHTLQAHLSNLISIPKKVGMSKQTFFWSFVAALMVSVNMQDLTSHLVSNCISNK